MRLLLADDDGNVYEVEDGIEEYDLDKPFAAATVIASIQQQIHLCNERSK